MLPSPSEEKVASHGRHSLHHLPRISHLSYRASPRVLNPPLLPLFHRLRALLVFSCRAYDDPRRIFIIVVEPTIVILRVSSQILRFYLSSSFSSFFLLFLLLCLSLSFPLSFHSACLLFRLYSYHCTSCTLRFFVHPSSGFIQATIQFRVSLNLRFCRLVKSESLYRKNKVLVKYKMFEIYDVSSYIVHRIGFSSFYILVSIRLFHWVFSFIQAAIKLRVSLNLWFYWMSSVARLLPRGNLGQLITLSACILPFCYLNGQRAAANKTLPSSMLLYYVLWTHFPILMLCDAAINDEGM